MLNPFPELLVFGFFAPTLLRIAAAIAFGSIAYLQYKRREEIAATRFPIIGHGGVWMWVSITVEVLITISLLLGYYTQWAALVGLIVAIKHAIFAKRYPRAVPLCRGEYYFLIFICLSLLLSGAGALAFDLPL